MMPQTLMELMRHESIDTTLKFYVGWNAQATPEVLWKAAEKAGLGTILGTTAEKRPLRFEDVETNTLVFSSTGGGS